MFEVSVSCRDVECFVELLGRERVDAVRGLAGDVKWLIGERAIWNINSCRRPRGPAGARRGGACVARPPRLAPRDRSPRAATNRRHEGLLVHHPEDPAELAALLARVLDDPALAQRLGEAGYERVRVRYLSIAALEHWAKLVRLLMDVTATTVVH